MMAQPVDLVVFIIKIIALIKSSLLVRSVCLHEVLTFYNEENDGACEFNKEMFTNVFIGTENEDAKRCQINCSIKSLDPLYKDMDASKKYEIEELKIVFSSTTYTFILEKQCPNHMYPNKDVYVTINCEGKYLQDRGIGESCVNDNQCVNVNVNSTCDETTQLCQCKSGHLYLWENKTCSPVQELGEMCYDSRQCKWMNPYSMCNNENECECQRGYVKLNNSCMPERRLNETCKDDLQCSMVTTNSTCNRTTKLCTCNEGHLQMMNMCLHGRLVEEILNHCKRVQLSIETLTNKNVEQICSMHSETFLSTSTSIEPMQYLFITRTNAVKEKINQPRSVEVSNAVYSEPIKHKNKKCNTGIAVEMLFTITYMKTLAMSVSKQTMTMCHS